VPSDYEPHQEEMYQAIADTVNSRTYGFDHCRQPAPSLEIDPERRARWMEAVEKESISRIRSGIHKDKVRGLHEENWPASLWDYLYQRGLDIKRRHGLDK